MTDSIQNLLSQYTSEIKKIYGCHLKSIILYGSYARGDFTNNSDIDIMLLVDLTDVELDNYSDDLAELGFKYNVAYNIWMMPVVKNVVHFHQWAKVYPFYINVQEEGVILYEAA
ncbi:DNA polymerase beta domain protein region [Desulfitobacterium hafniense DCB-2]|uniref:DNA polymerase beta domain protein region n=1 Tax=Desulfitobacterium hafniense (strain DSM 10664 / DCB-2) TaxID=272564 RepID=B8FTT0_DESHD|nr:nucleotidyltransferase domain-containing protein [Desulfitobacterium hafniense]ACL22172.1 DNA polymerase beta domain protein region [Desulfitobacterium hafniense DCB-2]